MGQPETKELAQGVAEALARQAEAIHGKLSEQEFFLKVVIRDIRTALPALRGIEVIPGKPDTVLTETGLASGERELIERYSLRKLIDALAELLEKQHRGRTSAAARAGVEADRVRKMLKLHRALLKLDPQSFEAALDGIWRTLRR